MRRSFLNTRSPKGQREAAALAGNSFTHSDEEEVLLKQLDRGSTLIKLAMVGSNQR